MHDRNIPVRHVPETVTCSMIDVVVGGGYRPGPIFRLAIGRTPRRTHPTTAKKSRFLRRLFFGRAADQAPVRDDPMASAIIGRARASSFVGMFKVKGNHQVTSMISAE